MKTFVLFMYFCFLSLYHMQCDTSVSSPVNNDIPVGMVKIIAAGKTYHMGSDQGMDNEKPVHQVTFSQDFLMDASEVTQKDYVQLMGVNPSHFKGEQLPVETVTWFDAVLYCNARSKKDSLDTVYTYISVLGTPGNGCEDLENLAIYLDRNGYRLPTEAQWEYACRGGTTTEYYWGDDSTDLDPYAWFTENSDSITHPVGTKLPNPFRLYDMGGNVYEWCHDWFDDNYYSNSPVNDPTGPDNGSFRSFRGGSWFLGANDCRSSFRFRIHPENALFDVGFRVVRPW